MCVKMRSTAAAVSFIYEHKA